jgi:hypothetical protein
MVNARILGMKNSQKGSAKTWVITLVVLIIIIGAGYVWYQNYGYNCDIGGVKYTGQKCKEFQIPANAAPQDEYSQIGQTMKDLQTNYYKNGAPAGFLVPTTVPSGYKPQSDPTLFTANSAMYAFSTGRGVPADKNIVFQEYASTTESYSQYVSSNASDSTVKIIKTFSYNGGNGEVITYTTNKNPNYTLAYDHNGNVEQISATNDSSITPDMLITTLEAMK